jgi:NAD(P)-dependent dehydrogenase (short-subunit alcohol dehydrogenase family)
MCANAVNAGSEGSARASFHGKVAIVTGASRGIGQAIALRLAAGGAKLVITARTVDSLADSAGSILRAGGAVECVATPDGNADRVVKTALDRFARIDILVNNAGTTKGGAFLSLTDEDWADGFGTKMFAAMRLCRAAWPALKAQGGSIVNIAGAGGRTPDAFFTMGGSVNAAVMAFTKALAQLGIEDGIQVNAVNPGFVKTSRLTHRIAEAAERWQVSLEQAEHRMYVEQKISGFGLPAEIAEIIAFIVSSKGRLFQGALIDADAGYTKGV